MTQPQFDAKIASKDGKMFLFIRGPFEVPDGLGLELRLVPIVDMREWPQIWKSEEEADVQGYSLQEDKG